VSCHSAQLVQKLAATPKMLSVTRRSQKNKMMFWALARVSFSADKIVSCDNKIFLWSILSKLLQLFYFIFTNSPITMIQVF
jgi:hypothetical protein